jgi:hypothetical protein
MRAEKNEASIRIAANVPADEKMTMHRNNFKPGLLVEKCFGAHTIA